MKHSLKITTPVSRCRFGIARRDITPPVGIYHRMWGAATHDRSEGVHRPLTATVIVMAPLGHEDELQVVVAIDHCLLFHEEMEHLVQRVGVARRIDRDRLLITFSHTHAAGLMETRRVDLPGGDLIAPYLEEMAQRIASALGEASDSLQSATVTYLEGRCDLAAHRDLWDAENETYVCGYNPAEIADDTLLVARVTGDEDQLLATIVNYACHPTTLAWDNRLISPDYPGAMREVVEQTTGAPCVFLQGASGDLGPRDGFVGDVTVADSNGRQLGYAVLQTLETAPPPRTQFKYTGPVVSGATIGTWRHESLSDVALQEKSQWRHDRWAIDLPYREGLATLEDTRSQLELWTAREQSARTAGDEAKARDARAMAERARRLLWRLEALPPGDAFPCPITLWRNGDAFFVGVEGEPYNRLQQALRERFPAAPIVVMVLAGGSRIGYLPTAEIYDTGIYQESIALVASGCLERLIDEVGRKIAEWLRE